MWLPTGGKLGALGASMIASSSWAECDELAKHIQMQLKQVRDGFTLDITHEINYDSNPNPNPKPNPNSNPNPNSIPGSSLKNRSNPKPSPNPDLNPNIGKLDFGVMRHGLAS